MYSLLPDMRDQVKVKLRKGEQNHICSCKFGLHFPLSSNLQCNPSILEPHSLPEFENISMKYDETVTGVQ